MSVLTCPSCGEGMLRHEEPDLTIDLCDACGGIFLDRDELDAMAETMAGDLEFRSAPAEALPESGGVRTCPRCREAPMEKVSLLRLSDLIFDRCPACQGYFLDRGELEATKLKLRELSTGEEEIREYREGHLVRVDRVSDVSFEEVVPTRVERPAAAMFLRSSAYFSEPLGIGLRLLPEGWSTRLAKAFGLYSGEDLETGDPDFDRAFVVRARAAEQLDEALWEDVRDDLLAVAAGEYSIGGGEGRLEVDDVRITYTEGPYGERPVEDLREGADPLLEVLTSVASAMEQGLSA